MDRMRFSRGAKLFLLTVISFCGLSFWSSLKDQKLQNSPLSIEGYSVSMNKKSMAAIDSDTKDDTKRHILINSSDEAKNIHIESGNTVKAYDDQIDIAKNNIGRTNISAQFKQTRTILMSYMRSGSTFTGDLFQASPDVMYMYEPLLYTNDADELSRKTPIRLRLIHKFRQDSNPPETLDYVLDTLRCNLTGSNLRYMIGYSYSRSFDDYAACVKSTDSNDCSQNITKRCQYSRNVISKILRLKMWEVDDLLARDPELQIIHLVRDPRGIAMSRKVANYYFNLRTLCARMNNDASMSIDLEKKYPGRILTVRYEDLAISPMNITKKLFKHAGVIWTSQVTQKVQDLTSPTDNTFDEKIFGTKRKNSAATAFNWRTKLPFSTALEIQKSCTAIMELYGYNSFSTHTEMVNLEHPSTRYNYTNKYYKGETFRLPGL